MFENMALPYMSPIRVLTYLNLADQTSPSFFERVFFKSIFNMTLLDIHFLFSADFPEINVSNIKISVFLHKLFIYSCVKLTTCPPPSFAVKFVFCEDVQLI